MENKESNLYCQTTFYNFKIGLGAGVFRLRSTKTTRISLPFKTVSDPTLYIHFEMTINRPLRGGEKVFIQVIVTLVHTKNSFAKSFRIKLNNAVRLLRILMNVTTQILVLQHLYI